MNSAFYDTLWERQWDDMNQFGPFHRHIRRIILELIEGLQFGSVLDVGCGRGSLLEEIGQRFDGVHLNGVDLSNSAVSLARRILPAGNFHRVNVAEQPLEDIFDLVLCSEVLEHIDDDVAALRNIRSMTGRYLVVSTIQGKMRSFEKHVGHVRNYRRGELVNKINSTGFRVQKVIEWGFPFYSPLYRDFLDLLDGQGTTGKFGLSKRIIATGLYSLFHLNSSSKGDEIFVLAEAA